MSAPQVIMVVWLSLELGAGLVLHGKEKAGTYSFLSNIIHVVLMLIVLNWGGFFD